MKVRITNYENHADKSVTLFETEMPTREAAYALELLERWGCVIAMQDGEDSTGRQKQRLMTEREVVQRAFNIANLAFTEMRVRNQVIQLPDLNEINAESDAERDSERAAKRAKKKENA